MQKKFFPLFFLLFFSTAFATESKIKEYKVAADFKSGTFSSVALADNGILSLAPATRKIFDAKAQHIWQIAASGKTIYAAAGSPAHVLRIKGEKADTVFSSPEPAIFTMTAVNNTLYFAPAPGGKLFRLQNGKAQLFAELDVKYIWDILPLKKSLLVATGVPGLILKLDANARIDTFYTSNESHIRTLARDGKGQIYAGSAESGLIFRFDASGNPFVLYDSPESEIFEIIPTATGEIWAAGLSEKLPRSVIPTMKSASPKKGSNGKSKNGDVIAPKIPSNGGNGKGALYKISRNGVARNFWTGVSERLQSVLRQKDGSLLVGTGDDGRVFRLDPNGGKKQLLDFDAEQIVSMLPMNQSSLLATANSGLIYRVDQNAAPSGHFESAPFDAGSFTRWGSLSWRGEGKITFSVRSGNTADPDETWSDWQHFGFSETPLKLDAPTARFIQWRADFSPGSQLHRVWFGYKQQNIAPVLNNIKLHEPGVAFPGAVKDGRDGDGQASGSSARKKTTKSGFQSIGWNMHDENGDALVCEISYQMQGAQYWRTMVEDYTAAVYSWDTRAQEDGFYRVKIAISDKKNNLTNHFTTVKTSEYFLVDNSPPQITGLQNSGKKVMFSAADKFSRIGAAFFALDSGEWQALTPEDGVTDSSVEKFSIDCRDFHKGAHTVMIKVGDARKNTAYRHLNVNF